MGPRLLTFAADAVGKLPNRDHRFRDSLTVEAPARQWNRSTASPGGVLQRTNAMLAVMVGDRDEFVEDSAFILLGYPRVSSPGRGQEFPFRHLADFSAPEAASHLLGSILVEATTFVE